LSENKETTTEERKRFRRLIKDNVLNEIVPEVPDAIPYTSIQDLYNEVYVYVKDHWVLGEDNNYHLVTTFIMATWRVKDLDECVYLYINAPKGHGKTQGCEVLEQTCYLAVAACYATRAATMRVSDGTDCTLILDEAENYIQANLPSEMVALLNAGQRRRTKLLVVEEVQEVDEKGKQVTRRKPVAREAFGFKVLASRTDIFDTLPDRAFELVLPKGRPKCRRIDKDRARILRGKLRYFKENGTLVTPTLFSKEDLERMDPRLEDLTNILMSAIPVDKHPLLQQIALHEVTVRAERMADTFEGRLLGIIKELVEDKAEFKQIQTTGLIPTETITAYYNLKFPDQYHPMSSTIVGRTLSRLRLERKKMRLGGQEIRGFAYDEVHLNKLFSDFFIPNIDATKSVGETLETDKTLKTDYSSPDMPPTNSKVAPNPPSQVYQVSQDNTRRVSIEENSV
jgi:hypothetical protein